MLHNVHLTASAPDPEAVAEASLRGVQPSPVGGHGDQVEADGIEGRAHGMRASVEGGLPRKADVSDDPMEEEDLKPALQPAVTSEEGGPPIPPTSASAAAAHSQSPLRGTKRPRQESQWGSASSLERVNPPAPRGVGRSASGGTNDYDDAMEEEEGEEGGALDVFRALEQDFGPDSDVWRPWRRIPEDDMQKQQQDPDAGPLPGPEGNPEGNPEADEEPKTEGVKTDTDVDSGSGSAKAASKESKRRVPTWLGSNKPVTRLPGSIEVEQEVYRVLKKVEGQIESERRQRQERLQGRQGLGGQLYKLGLEEEPWRAPPMEAPAVRLLTAALTEHVTQVKLFRLLHTS